MVRLPPLSHLFVAAVTQSRKSSAVAIPMLLDGTEHCSVMVHDPKEPGELFDATAGYRSCFSQVIAFQPLHEDSDCYDPLSAVRWGTPFVVRDLQILSDMLTDPDGDLAKRSDDNSRHFMQSASDLNLGILAYARDTWPNCTLPDIYELVCGALAMKDLIEVMGNGTLKDDLLQALVTRACQTFKSTADRELSAVLNTAKRALRLWSDPLVCHATSRSDFTLADLRDAPQPLSLYMSFPFEDQDRLRPLSRLIIRQCLEFAARRKTRRGERRHPLFFLADEVQALGYFPLLKQGLTYFLGMGVTMALMTPSMREFQAIWGRDHPFLENTSTKLAFGMRERDIAELFTKNSGRHTVTYTQVQADQKTGRTTTSERTQEEPFLTPEWLMDLDPSLMYCRMENLNVLLEKSSYLDDPELFAKSEIPYVRNALTAPTAP